MEVETINQETTATKTNHSVSYLDPDSNKTAAKKENYNIYWTIRNLNTDWTLNYKEFLFT